MEHLDSSPFWFPLYEWRLRASATEHEWRARLSVGSVSRGHFVLDRKLENTLVPAGARRLRGNFPVLLLFVQTEFQNLFLKEESFM